MCVGRKASVEYGVFCSSVFSVRERKVLPEWKNTKHVNRKCQDISQAAPFSFREKAEYATRGGSSTFKNMPFLRQEGRLLRARKAYTWTQDITRWFLAGYIFCYRWCYLRVVSVANLVVCKDFYHHMNSPLSHTSHPTKAETLCVLCMPKALCGLETCAKRLC